MMSNKEDKVYDDDNKSLVATVEICKENQQDDKGKFDLEDLLCITLENYKVNMQNDENEVQTKLEHCKSCKNFENCLHQTTKENATLKNAMYISNERSKTRLHREYQRYRITCIQE